MHNGRLFSGNIGDSRSILCSNKDGKKYSRNLTVDHKPSLPLEKMRIEASGGEVYEYMNDSEEAYGPPRVWVRGEKYPGLAVSRSFGDSVAASVGVISSPDVTEVFLDYYDKAIVIASDGVWDMLTNEEVTNIAVKYAKINQPEKAANTIINKARKKWEEEEGAHIDDISCIVIVLTSE